MALLSLLAQVWNDYLNSIRVFLLVLLKKIFIPCSIYEIKTLYLSIHLIYDIEK